MKQLLAPVIGGLLAGYYVGIDAPRQRHIEAIYGKEAMAIAQFAPQRCDCSLLDTGFVVCANCALDYSTQGKDVAKNELFEILAFSSAGDSAASESLHHGSAYRLGGAGVRGVLPAEENTSEVSEQKQPSAYAGADDWNLYH